MVRPAGYTALLAGLMIMQAQGQGQPAHPGNMQYQAQEVPHMQQHAQQVPQMQQEPDQVHHMQQEVPHQHPSPYGAEQYQRGIPKHHVPPPNQPSQPQRKQGKRRNKLRNKDHVRDRNHIRQHLEGQVQKPEDHMTEEELQFHYFKMHDYDHNNKLDGIELISAMTHFHAETEENPNRSLADDEITSLVDTILKTDDRNNDGYVDYYEFVLSQQERDHAGNNQIPGQ